MEHKHSYSDIHNTCTFKEYIDQYNPVKLEVGETYIQKPHTMSQTKYKILFIHDGIAMGVETEPKFPLISKAVNHCMFYASNGFKYQDTVRPSYRLQNINKES